MVRNVQAEPALEQVADVLPMLALTEKPEPRNLLIDLAFLGLSTMTRAIPLPAAPPFSDLDAAGVRRLAAAALGAAAFRVLVSAEAAEPFVDLVDLRATITSDPVIPNLFWSSHPAGSRRREAWFGVVADCLGDNSWYTTFWAGLHDPRLPIS